MYTGTWTSCGSCTQIWAGNHQKNASFNILPLRCFWFVTFFILSLLSFYADFVGVLAGMKDLTVFADGRLVGHNNGIWDVARLISFSSETKIIAVSVYNEPEYLTGFLGVFSNGVVTDRSWKCINTNSPGKGWEQTNFNDDAWPHAYMSYNNSVRRAYGIPSSIYWINPVIDNAIRFFCRRRFSKEERNSTNSKYQWKSLNFFDCVCFCIVLLAN